MEHHTVKENPSVEEILDSGAGNGIRFYREQVVELVSLAGGC